MQENFIPTDQSREPVLFVSDNETFYRKLFKFCSYFFTFAGVIISLIFVFFTKIGDGYKRYIHDIFYYFGRIYKEDRYIHFANTQIDAVTIYSRLSLSTCFAVITLLGTVTFSVLAFVSLIKTAVKKKSIKYAFPVICVLCYVVGCLLLIGQEYSYLDFTSYRDDALYSAENTHSVLRFDKMTSFGLVFSGIAIALGTASGKLAAVDCGNRKNSADFILNGIIVVMAFIIAVLSSYSYYVRKMNDRYYKEIIKAPLLHLPLYFASATNVPLTTLICASTATCITIALAVVACVAIVKIVRKDTASVMGLSIASVILSLLLSVLHLIIIIVCNKNSSKPEYYMPLKPIFSFVLSNIMLGVSIFKKAYGKKRIS